MNIPDSNADVHEIQSFVNVALATAAGGEGDLSHDRLSHLRTVGSGFASLIYNFPKDANFFQLKEACKSVWDALEKNENLPKLLVIIILPLFCKKGRPVGRASDIRLKQGVGQPSFKVAILCTTKRTKLISWGLGEQNIVSLQYYRNYQYH